MKRVKSEVELWDESLTPKSLIIKHALFNGGMIILSGLHQGSNSESSFPDAQWIPPNSFTSMIDDDVEIKACAEEFVSFNDVLENQIASFADLASWRRDQKLHNASYPIRSRRKRKGF